MTYEARQEKTFAHYTFSSRMLMITYGE